MWIVINLDKLDNIEEVVNYIESIYYEYNKEIILSVVSNISIKETFLILYKIVNILSEYNVKIRRGPILHENVIISHNRVVRLSNNNYNTFYELFNKRSEYEYSRSLSK